MITLAQWPGVASWMGLDKLNLDTAVQTDIATQILQTALAVPDGTKAVSYTHLDVYKRQTRRCTTFSMPM